MQGVASFELACKNQPFYPLAQMNVLCHDYLNNDGRGKMEECLKLHFDTGGLQSEECKIHIAHVIDTQRADIHVDPILNEACGVDDNKYCEGKEKGQRKYSCC